jgi:tartrate dehydratase beta subunit/fumarate hydratase class I family protein
MLDNTDPEYVSMRDRAHERLREIEEQREQEDTDMLIRLIKVRERLWT